MSILARVLDDLACPLWSRETETIVDATGRCWVPRLQHVPLSAPRYDGSAKTETAARIKVLYSSNTALGVLSEPALYPSIGIHEPTQRPVVVLAGSIASLVEAREQCVVPYPYPLDDAPIRLKAIADDLLASLICSEVDADGLLLLIEPDEGFACAIRAVASSKGVGLACVTSSTNKSPAAEFVQIHPRASSRTIKQLLPDSVGQSDSLTTRIQECLGGSLRIDNVKSIRARDSSSAPVNSLLEDAVESVGKTDFDVAVFSTQDFATKRQKSGATLD
ncbi:MAG: hypothetical protein MMC33_007866 [Icmadophila ericetorum]|nr:hypothetical protein [Icmadophila ericetorum]